MSILEHCKEFIDRWMYGYMNHLESWYYI